MNRNLIRLLLCGCISLLSTPIVRQARAQSPDENVTAEKDTLMAPGADPSFEVAAIRPSDPIDPHAADGWSFESEGRRIACRRATLVDILSVAYAVQVRQIVGGPAWLSKDRFDINGTPDIPGVPDVPQLQGMYKKLLAERFHLALHKEVREMPIYAITVAKGGPLLKVADPQERFNTASSSDIGSRTLKFTSISMKNFALNLNLYEDRPVVDQTSLPGRYDFTLKWTFDISLEGEPGAPPSLFTAVKEQLGLKMDAVRGPAEVIVIDHVERPSEN